MATIREHLMFAADTLRRNRVPYPMREARRLLTKMSLVSSPERTPKKKNTLTLEYISAHPDEDLSEEEQAEFEIITQERAERRPLAYVTGVKEFYGREFRVDERVLIPRPETEQLVARTIAAEHDMQNNATPRILDVGTGSGVIAVTLAHELPNAVIVASDASIDALESASRNSMQLDWERNNTDFTEYLHAVVDSKTFPAEYGGVQFCKSDLLTDIDAQFDIIVANLPYVSRDWGVEKKFPEIAYEPAKALYADDNGLALIKKLIRQSPKKLSENGRLIMEMDPRQVEEATNYAKKYGFEVENDVPFALTLRRRAA